MIDASGLPPEIRAELAELWHARAYSESSVKNVFDELVRELGATGAHSDVIDLARRAAGDEACHAAICAELADAYHGTPLVHASAPRVRLPDYTTSLRLRAALHAVNLCCIGETIATAFVQACLAECADEGLHEVHRSHLADEVRHARVGWAHLASLSSDQRAEVAAYLPELLRAQLAAWQSRIAELPERGVPGHGYPPRAALLTAVQAAVRDLVVPGFAYVGVDVGLLET